MSTPTEKPINPIDPFVHVPHETHGRGGREHHPIESDGEPIRSPYAPAKARERAGAEGDPGENDPLWSPYAPKKARTQSVQAPHVAMTESAAPIAPPGGLESLRERSERHALDGELNTLLQPAHPHSQQPEHPVAARRDESIRDLKRLETTLRRIQREEVAARIPRAAQLPPVPGLVTPDASGRRRGREMPDFPSPRSLEPERMPPPPTRSRRDKLRAPLVILIASIFAIPIGYYFSTGGWSPSSRPSPGPQTASLGLQPNAPPSSIVEQEVPPAIVLMKQGEQLIAAGDVVTARTVLQRAAEAGNAGAAMALGATYDPNVLAKLGVVGVSADVGKARSWYQRAETLGSPDARGRLNVLADR